MTSFSLLLLVISLTLAFEFSNGWHDAANSIATVVSTRVLTPFRAVAWAAFWNFVAAFFFGTAVAGTIGKGMVHIEMVNQQVLLAGLLGAITWNTITLILGLPTSSSHALIGSFGGAAVAKAGFHALIFGGWLKPVTFIFLSPLIGMLLGMTVTIITSWIVRRQRPLKVDKWFRRLLQLRPRHQRRAERHGHYHDGARGRRSAQVLRRSLLGNHLLPLGHRRGNHGRRLAHHQDHGPAHHQTQSFRRLRGRNRWRAHPRRHRRLWHSRQHHAHDHRRHCRRRSFAPSFRCSLGHHSPHRLGLGTYHPRRRSAWSHSFSSRPILGKMTLLGHIDRRELTVLSSCALSENPSYHTESVPTLSIWSKTAAECRCTRFSPTPSWQ